MKTVFIAAGAALLAVVVTCAVRVARLPAPAAAGAPVAPLALDADGAIARLAAGLRIPTVSFEDRAKISGEALDAFAAHLQKSFPKVHAAMTREAIGKSLLYTWTGADAAAAPILLIAHMDVVPVEPGTEAKWTHPAFGGVIADGYVWGRGARDDKSSVLALMEAAEWLLASGYTPRRTVYFGFGHDEEIGGTEGATAVAAELKRRGVMAEFLLDEGGAVLDGIVAGVPRPVAAIMAAEKGYMTVKLSTKSEGGHSSRPPPQTAIGRLARAVARVQEAPLPTHLVRPVTDMLDRLAPEMAFKTRLALANRWLFGPLIERNFAAAMTTNPLVRTTTAPTVFRAGIKDNVLPSEASALVNFRLLPGDTKAGVMEHVRRVIDDPEVALAEDGGFATEASESSPTDNAAYELLARTAHEIFPDAVLSTGLVTGATDARNYAGTYRARYNFSPATLTPADLPTIHGTDERIAVDNYLGMVRFYVQLLRNDSLSPN